MSAPSEINPYDKFESEPRWTDEEFDFYTAPGDWSHQTTAPDLAGIVLVFGAGAALQVVDFVGPFVHFAALAVYGVCSYLWARIRYRAVHRISGNAYVISFAKSYRSREWRRRSFRWDDVVDIEIVATKSFTKPPVDFADVALLTKDGRIQLRMQFWPAEAEELVATLKSMSRHAKLSRASRGGYRGARANEADVESWVEDSTLEREQVK